MDRQSTMTSIEVPYDDYTETQYDVRPEAETASDTSQDSDAMRIAERLRAGRQEGSDTHLNYIAQDPGLALYRHEELQLVLDAANRTELVQDRRIANQRVMEKLANLGVSVFLISYECDDVWKEVKHCIFEASNMQLYNCSPDRCLLYEDSRGRLFNLLVGGDFQGLQGSYEAMLDRASGLEAICALVVLIRAFACVELREGIRPAYIALILGLVLIEEISNSWVNVSMLVWGMPSISAFTLSQPVSVDWPKQALLLILSISAVLEAGSRAQSIATLVGIGWACCVLCANVGARAWRHLKWKSMPYRGHGRIVVSFLAAIATGLVIPYVGFRQAQSGGQVALETVLIGSLIVAAVFIVSDFDAVQEFIILGSENCNQDPVNFGVGIWWGLTVIISMYFCKRIPVSAYYKMKDDSKRESDLDKSTTSIIPFIPEPEPLVEQEQASPVGYRVKQIPDFKLDPNGSAKPHLPSAFLAFEVVLGVTMAIGIGALMVYSAFTDKDDNITSGT